MDFALSIPFRTLLNLESEVVALRREKTSAALVSAFAAIDSTDFVESVAVVSCENPIGKSGLKDLSQDIRPWFSKALATVCFSSNYTEFVKHRFLDTREPELQNLIQSMSVSANVEFYDNTLAVASLTGSLDLSCVPVSWRAPDFERFLSDFAEAFVSPVNNAILAPVLKALMDFSDRKRNQDSFVRPPRNYLVFNDLNHHPFPEWDDDVSPFFWAHRVYSLSDINTKAEAIRELLRLDEIETHGKADDDGVRFYVGTSVVERSSLFQDFLSACSIAQMFYCIFDILNEGQNRIYRELSATQKRSAVSGIIVKYHKMENFIEYVFNEMSDVEISLQSARRRYFASLSDVFGTEKLLGVLQRRDRIVESRLERKTYEIQRTDRKILQFWLFLLGATQVVGLLIDLFMFLGDKSQRMIPGVVELFQWLDVNVTFNILSVLIIAGALYASFRRQ